MKKTFLITSIFCLIINYLFIIDSCLSQWQPDVQMTFQKPYEPIYNYIGAYSIAAYENFVHLVWCDGREGLGQVYYNRSTDGGKSWGIEKKLIINAEFSGLPCISVSGQVVHLVWYNYTDENNGICYKRSTNGGLNWGTDIMISDSESQMPESPLVSVSENIVHIVWCEHSDESYEIYYKRSTDGGTIWGLANRISTSSAITYNPSISVSKLFVHIVWEEYSNKFKKLIYKRSTDGGANWETETQLKINSDKPDNPSISVNELIGLILWNDNREMNTQVYYKRTTDGGTTWGADTKLTNSESMSNNPSVIIYGSNVHVVWCDFRDNNEEIYYKNSKDGGLTWETDTRLTNNSGNSWYPYISVSGKAVHIIWNDDRNRNNLDFDLYYKYNPNGNALE